MHGVTIGLARRGQENRVLEARLFGLEGLYRQTGAPAKSLELPEAAPPAPTPAQLEGLVKLAASYGVIYVPPKK
jgi:hypothetical protein